MVPWKLRNARVEIYRDNIYEPMAEFVTTRTPKCYFLATVSVTSYTVVVAGVFVPVLLPFQVPAYNLANTTSAAAATACTISR